MAKKSGTADRPKAMRELLAYQLAGHGAHISFAAAVKDFPLELAGQRVPHLDHTAWGLVYHLRVAQWDMLEYARGGEHESLAYPSGYWPKTDGPQDAQEWEQTARGFGRGAIYSRDGILVASVAQEGLIRRHSNWTSPAGKQK